MVTMYPAIGREAVAVQLLADVTVAMQEAIDSRALGRNADFFEYGGDSMAAIQVVMDLRRSLDITVPIEAVQLHPTPALLAEYLLMLTAEGNERGLPASRPDGEVVALSPVQQSIYEAMRLWAPVGVYNTSLVYRLTGSVDCGRLETSLAEAAYHHEAARAMLVNQDRRVGLAVTNNVIPEIIVDNSSADELLIRRRITEFLKEYIDPAVQSPLRVFLTDRLAGRLEETRYLAISACQLMFDEETLGSYLATATEFYRGRSAPPEIRRLISPMPVAPGDPQPVMPRTWTRFAFQRARSDIFDVSGTRQTMHLSPAQVSGLRALGSRNSATLYEAMLSLIWTLAAAGGSQAVMLCGTFRQPAVDAGATHAEGRPAGLKELRFGALGQDTLDQAMQRVKQTVRAAQSDEIKPVTDEAPPIVVSLQDGRTQELELDNAHVEIVDWDNDTARFEMALLIHLRSGRPRIIAEYLRQCCDDSDVSAFLDDLRNLLARCVGLSASGGYAREDGL